MRFNLLFWAVASLAAAQSSVSQSAAWNRPAAPFRIAGNLYYAGAEGVSSFPIVTPAGSILLDGGLPESAPQIEKNIAALGFRLADVKYPLNSHAHFDHAGGLAQLKRDSGAQLIASRADAAVIAAGQGRDLPAVRVDRVVADGGKVELGGAVMTAVLTPGHTKGCTTWTMPVSAEGKIYNVVFYLQHLGGGSIERQSRESADNLRLPPQFRRAGEAAMRRIPGPASGVFPHGRKAGQTRGGRSESVDRSE